MKKSIAIAVSLAAALGFVASLYLPAFYFEYREPLSGLEVLQIGWMGIFLIIEVRWFANPFFVLVVFNNIALSPARASSAIVIILTLASICLPAMVWFNEGSGTPVTRLGIGAYIWAASLLLASVFNCFIPRSLGGETDAPNE
jgi:hypothetical protein